MPACAGRQVEDFYFLSRACLVKDERNLDRFDRVFGEVFKGIAALPDAIEAEIPEEWLRLVSAAALVARRTRRASRSSAAGRRSWRRCSSVSQSRRSGTPAATNGSAPAARRPSAPTATIRPACASARRKAGTGARSRCGTSASSRTSTRRSRSARATSRWRCAGCARSPARAPPRSSISPAPSAARREKGYLDIRMVPERHNTVKVLMFFDVGGSMDWHIKGAEELFSAARSEFKHLEYYYFHNCLYEQVWKHNARRRSELTADLGRAAHLPARLQGHLRRRRLDEPLRADARRRRRRAHERRGRAHSGCAASPRPTGTASGSTRCPRSIGAIRRRSP